MVKLSVIQNKTQLGKGNNSFHNYILWFMKDKFQERLLWLRPDMGDVINGPPSK